METHEKSPRSLGTALRRAAGLVCPDCGRGKLFRGWFRMNASCESCGLSFDRGPGFYLGSIYFNYGLTALLVGGSFLGLWLGGVLSQQQALGVAIALAVLFPLWFFRYARGLWLAMDRFLDRDG